MKQHITPKQLKELSEKGKQALWDYWVSLKLSEEETLKTEKAGIGFTFALPLLSIGQMIEFLDENLDGMRLRDKWYVDRDVKGTVYDWTNSKELADALWEACKEILNETEKTKSMVQ